MIVLVGGGVAIGEVNLSFSRWISMYPIQETSVLSHLPVTCDDCRSKDSVCLLLKQKDEGKREDGGREKSKCTTEPSKG